MSKLFSFIGLVLVSLICQYANAQSKTEGPALKVNKELHDFGTIYENSKGSCAFIFTNTGNKPLQIISAKGSCGCTVPTFSREPIMPGKSDFMKVVYDTKRLGPINTSVTIFTNAQNAKMKVVHLKGKVIRPIHIPKTPTPKKN